MKNSNESGLILGFFPKTKKHYRIDWLGDVCYPDKRDSYRQPSIAVSLSEVVRTKKGYESAAPKQRQIQRYAPVGLLSLLQIGDVWQAGQRVDTAPATWTAFKNLQINQDSTRIIKAGAEFQDRGFLIPFSAHAGHSQHTQSYCLLTRLPGSKLLVIPCAELIRFYFGSSSKLLGRLFTPPLRRESLYLFDSLRPRSGRLVLQLGPGMSGYSAADIGRIARSNDAWHAAATIGTSLLRGSTRRQRAYPYTHFPFQGATNLVVTGKWLPLGKIAEQTFLVQTIVSCSHPFPFQTLQYRMGYSSNLSNNRTQKELSNMTSQNGIRSVAKKPSEFVNQDPSQALHPVQLTFSKRPKFPDLEGKAVFRLQLPPLSMVNCNSKFARSSQVTAMGVADATGTRRQVRPAEVAVGNESPDINNAPKFLQNTLKQLASNSGISFKSITESPSDGWCIPIHALQEDQRPIDKRLMIKRDGQVRPRRVCVLQISGANQRLAYLAVIEGKPAHLYFSKSGIAQRSTLSSLIQSAALDFITRGSSERTALVEVLGRFLDY
uniref:TnsE C-terminal domain-containing protein n=1 Tax=Curvibacter symbiont subsp. Hydra magnipapillata TaxID=667019 RepID=C9YF95_CURXX|nr:hypothetical protein Csp_D32510 [Curvibacter putative symbiont of Hydra magnipapillata]